MELKGKDLFSISPEELIKKYKLTKFIAKQIVEWVEEESDEYDSFLVNGDQ